MTEKRVPTDAQIAERALASKWVMLGEMNGLIRAAKFVAGWHISKGGYTEMAHRLREMAEESGGKIWECKDIGEP